MTALNDDACITPLPSGAFRVRVRHRGQAVSTTAATPEAARELRDAIKQRIVDGELVPTKGASCRDLGPRFLASRAGNRDVDNDESRWHRHIARAAWARLPPAAITRNDGAEWLKALTKRIVEPPPNADPRRRAGKRVKKIGRSTRHHCLVLARRFFEWCLDKGTFGVTTNPFMGLSVEREDGDENAGYQDSWYLDLDEQFRFRQVWHAFQDTRRRERPIVEFAIGTGLREGEQWCLHLKDVHVDGPSPHIIVRYGSWDREEERYLTPKGKKGSNRARVVPLFGLALDAAREWLAQLPHYAPNNPLKLMFPTERGARRTRAPRSWGDAIEAFGVVPRIGREPWWHLLRHTFASSCVSGWWGIRWPLDVLSKILGHTDVRTTQIYAHLAPKVVDDMAARAHAAYKLRGHVAATVAKGRCANSGDDWYARSDSNGRLPASKAPASTTFTADSERHGPDVAALVHVLRDIRDGRYEPEAPLVHGLTKALDSALDSYAAAVATEEAS